jgi:hypothetical protein
VKLAQKLLGTRSILFATWKVRTSRPAHPLFSYSYELLFPQLLCFDNHLSCPAVYYPSLHCGSDLSALSVRVFPLWLTTYFQQLASLFSLFVAFLRPPLFVFRNLQPLFQKCRGMASAGFAWRILGWGYSLSLRTSAPSASLRYPLAFTVAARATVTFDFQLSIVDFPLHSAKIMPNRL